MKKEDILKPPRRPQHLKFALEYIATSDAAASYMYAYPNVKRESAIRSASLLLKKDDIRKFIDDYYLYYSDEEARNIIRKNKWIKNMEKIADLPIHISPQQTLQANIKLSEWGFQLKEIEARERAEEERARLEEELKAREESKQNKEK